MGAGLVSAQCLFPPGWYFWRAAAAAAPGFEVWLRRRAYGQRAPEPGSGRGALCPPAASASAQGALCLPNSHKLEMSSPSLVLLKLREKGTSSLLPSVTAAKAGKIQCQNKFWLLTRYLLSRFLVGLALMLCFCCAAAS